MPTLALLAAVFPFKMHSYRLVVSVDLGPMNVKSLQPRVEVALRHFSWQTIALGMLKIEVMSALG